MVSFSDDIYQLVAQYDPSYSISEHQLNEEIEKYPFFHTLYLLKGHLLKDLPEHNIERELPHLAVHVSDRSKLYDIIHNKVLVEITHEAPAPDKKELKVDEAQEKQAVTQTSVPKKKRVSNKAVSKAKKKTKKSVKPASPPTQTTSRRDNVPISFAEWLKTKSASVKTEEQTSKEKQQIPIDTSLQVEAAIYLEAKKSPKRLEDFLSDQIDRKKKKKKQIEESTQNRQMPEEEDSILANPDFVSETLAEILILQKKYEESIRAYETLSLKYPGKSSYFAAQIEKIRDKINR